MHLKKLFTHLDKPVAIEPLVTFRVIFGAMMVFSTVRFMVLGWIEDHYTNPLFHFKYFGFSWIPVFSTEWMYAIHILMALAALGVMLGLYYRISAFLLFVIFTYTELIDLTYYLNHYYFVSIACALLIIVPANRSFAFDIVRKPELQSSVTPSWTILIFKLQLGIVYFYAGIAKINYDWLIEALPLRIWMPANDTLPVVGWMLALPFMPYVFSWLGMLYDCTIVYWLSNKKTRLLAYASVIFFHSITGMMFQIGVFPLVMIGATLIFFSEQWHKKLISSLRIRFQGLHGSSVRFDHTDGQRPLTYLGDPILSSPEVGQPSQNRGNLFLKYALVVHFIFQILFPFRHVLYPGNLFWTEEGYRYSWRVMLMEKAGTATFYVKDSKTGKEGVVVNSEFLNAHQEKQMAMQPDMILQFAHFLKQWYEKQGVHKPAIRAEVYVTLNARPSQLIIDPEANLAALEDGWSPKNWIMPYQK